MIPRCPGASPPTTDTSTRPTSPRTSPRYGTRLEVAGLEVLVLDQIRPEIGLQAVKAIVPGMRGFRAAWLPGRLYDVPVQLGRLSTTTIYEDLNPMRLFL